MRQRLSVLVVLALVLASAVLPMARTSRAAELSLSSAEGTPGSAIQLAGSGFAANTSIAVRWEDAAGDVLATATASASGAFSGVNVVIPVTAAPGVHLLHVTDGITSITSSLTVLPIATLTVNPSSLLAGGTVSVNGSNFIPGAVVAVRWDAPDGAALGSILTATGNFTNLSVIIPANAAAGAHVLHASDGTRSASAALTVVGQTATLAITPNSQAAGGTVTASGSGFAVGESVSIRWESAAGAELANVAADSQGAFANVQLVVPANAAAGAHSIIALGASSLRQAAASITVTVTPPTQGTGSLTGMVVNAATGAAIQGAVEVLKLKAIIGDGELPENNEPVQTTSAADGSFSFTGLAQGVYRLTVAAAGYQSVMTDGVVVLSGEAAVINVALQPVTDNGGGDDDDDNDDRGGERPGWGCGDRNHEHTGPRGNGGDKESPCDKNKGRGHSDNNEGDNSGSGSPNQGSSNNDDNDSDDDDDDGNRGKGKGKDKDHPGKGGKHARVEVNAAANVGQVVSAKAAGKAEAELKHQPAKHDNNGKGNGKHGKK